MVVAMIYDAIFNNKVSTMLNDGWEKVNIFSGLEFLWGETDPNGIYITRLYFRKKM